jgi:hypothetical protein
MCLHLYYGLSFVRQKYHHKIPPGASFQNMTQNASFPINIITMEGWLKDDDFPKFQEGLDLFNDNELPASL